MVLGMLVLVILIIICIYAAGRKIYNELKIKRGQALLAGKVSYISVLLTKKQKDFKDYLQLIEARHICRIFEVDLIHHLFDQMCKLSSHSGSATQFLVVFAHLRWLPIPIDFYGFLSLHSKALCKRDIPNFPNFDSYNVC